MDDLSRTRELAKKVTPEFSGPWLSDGHGSVYAPDEHGAMQTKVADARGWGYLTGWGGLAMSQDDAAQKHDALTDYIAHLSPERVLGMVEEIARLREALRVIQGATTELYTSKVARDALDAQEPEG